MLCLELSAFGVYVVKKHKLYTGVFGLIIFLEFKCGVAIISVERLK